MDLETAIYTFLESDENNRWYTVDKLAQVTGSTSSDIFKVINNSDLFVSSSNSEHEPIIATRDRFRKEEPFFTKLVGALKNRID